MRLRESSGSLVGVSPKCRASKIQLGVESSEMGVDSDSAPAAYNCSRLTRWQLPPGLG